MNKKNPIIPVPIEKLHSFIYKRIPDSALSLETDEFMKDKEKAENFQRNALGPFFKV